MRRILLVSFFIILPWSAEAQHGDWCACGRHSTEPAFFQIDHTGTSFQNAAATSFSRWDQYSDVFSWNLGNGAGGSNGINEIIFFDPATTFNQYGIVIDSNTFGVTYINPISAFGSPPFNACPPPAGTTCGFFSETDVIMNSTFSRGWTTSPPNFSDTGPAYYIATALHEMGHVLGIHHNFDSLTTMNYYEDYATLYLSHSDGRAARGYHASQARTVEDIATYPFRFSGFQYSGTTVASASPSTVEQGQVLTVRNFTIENIGSETLSNVRLRLYLSSNDIISSIDHLIGTVSFSSFSTWWDTTGTNFTVPSSVPAGTYYLGAIVYKNTTETDGITYNNSWVLDASRRVTVTSSACSPDVYEPDGSSAQATTISSGVPTSHNICPVGDEDWSTFTLSAESGVTLETSGATGDTRMWLRESGGSQIEFDDDGGGGLFSFIDRTCGIDSLPAGTYFVQVDEFGDNDEIESYTLELTAVPCPCTPDAFEPDDNSGQAKTILPGITQMHNICPVGDEDWSSFTLSEESGITLMTSGAAGDTRMWLRNSGGSQIEFDDDGGGGLFSFIDRTCGIDSLPAGTYFVQVDEFGDNEEIESYALDLTVSSCGGCPANLVYADQTLSGTQNLEATSSITLGPNLIVNGTSIVMNAPSIRILSGTAIGGTFSAGTQPSGCP